MIREDLDLDLSRAIREAEQLGRNLGESLARGAAQGGERVVTELRRGESIRLNLPAPNIDTTRIAGAIEGAVDAANTSIDPIVAAGGTGDITAAINAAVDASDTGIIVAATVTGVAAIESACEDARCIDQGLKDSTESANGLGGALKVVAAALAAAGAADFFRDAVLAAADLGETVSKTRVVFGDAADGVLAVGENAAESMGLANVETLALASSFGILFQGAGLAQDQAAELSTSLVSLAGDQASLNNLQGGAGQAAEAFGAALRGENEAIRALGITLNETVITQIAYRDGLAEVGSELTAAQKIQATYTAIVEGSAIAQGDFANTIDSLPNQMRIVSASFTDLQARVGQELLPVIQQFVGVIRSEGLPALEDLATSVVPALIAVLTGLIPLFSATTTILVALAPTIEAIGLGLQSIPGPAIAAAAGLVLAGKAFFAIKAALANPALTITPFGVALVAIGVAAAATFAVLGRGAQQAREHEAAVTDLTTAVYANADAFDSATLALADYLATGTSSDFADLRDDLADVGITTEQLAGQLEAGRDGLVEFLSGLQAIGEIDATVNIEDLADGIDGVTGAFGAASAESIGMSDSVRDLTSAFVHQQGIVEESAEAATDLAAISGEVSQEYIDQALTAQRAAGEQENYARALERARAVQTAATTVAANLAHVLEAVAGASTAMAQADAETVLAIQQLRGALDPANTTLALTEAQMVQFTETLREGALSTQEFATQAALFGVSVDDLAAAEEVATERIATELADQETAFQAHADAVSAWRDDLVATMPDATAAFAGFNEESSIAEALQRFQDEAWAFQDAQHNLNFLLEQGFTDLAATLATQAPEVINQISGMTNEELAVLEASVDTSNEILAEGAVTAGTNAETFAGNYAGAFADAATGVTDADLPGVAGGEVDATGTAVSDAAGNETRGAVSEAVAAGRSIGLGLSLGIIGEQSRTAVERAGNALGRRAIDAINAGAGVHSPSDLTYLTGQEIVAGLVDGVNDSLDGAALAEAGLAAAEQFQAGVMAADWNVDLASRLAAEAATAPSVNEFVDGLQIRRGAVPDDFVGSSRDDFLHFLNQIYEDFRNPKTGMVDNAAASAEAMRLGNQAGQDRWNIMIQESADPEATAAAIAARFSVATGRGE